MYELTFDENYDQSGLFLMEVPNLVGESIQTDDTIILKGSDEITIMCTNDKTYELKYLETSNNYLLLEAGSEAQAKIIMTTQHTIECNEYIPKMFTTYNLLKKNCALTYNLSTGEDNFCFFNERFTLPQLFSMSELNHKEFDQMCLKFGIFEKNNCACLFDEVFLNEILFFILRVVSFHEDIQGFSVELIFNRLVELNERYKLVTMRLSDAEKAAILNNIFDYVDDSYLLNVNKTKIFLVKSLFSEKKGSDYKLEEFVKLFYSSLQVSLPRCITDKLVENNFNYINTTNCSDNLFEYYKGFDLRFLQGMCTIYCLRTQRDPLIKIVDVASLSEKFEERVNELFKLKDKWTTKEVVNFLSDLNVSNLHDRLGRLTQVSVEANPFDKDKQVSYYYLKKNPMIKNIKI